jgi:hypothetical protein
MIEIKKQLGNRCSFKAIERMLSHLQEVIMITQDQNDLFKFLIKSFFSSNGIEDSSSSFSSAMKFLKNSFSYSP